MRAQVNLEGLVVDQGVSSSVFPAGGGSFKPDRFMSLQALARNCESLGDGQNVDCMIATLVLDNIYQELNPAIRPAFIRHNDDVIEFSALGLALLVNRLPHLFEFEDLAYVFAVVFSEQEKA